MRCHKIGVHYSSRITQPLLRGGRQISKQCAKVPFLNYPYYIWRIAQCHTNGVIIGHPKYIIYMRVREKTLWLSLKELPSECYMKL